MSDFTNQVVLITGGAGGLGKACMEHFLESGATVYISDRNPQKVENLKKNFKDVHVAAGSSADIDKV